jgi:carboxyl-terminal processing protease
MRKFILLPLFIFSGLVDLFGQSNGFIVVYDTMHRIFSASYSFGRWKAINWNALNSKIRPKIVNAGAADDTIAFYTALKEYVTSVPDGHVSVRGWSGRKTVAMYQQIGGSYGFALIKLDDGRIIARLVNPGSPSALAGMHFGAEVMEVNDNPLNEVLDTVSVIWAEANPATRECKELNQFRFIGRAPVGKTMKIKFRNRGAIDPVTAILTAVDDNYATYNQTSMTPLDTGPVVSGKILQPNGYGYLKLTMEHGDDSAAVRKIYTDFRDVIMSFNNNGVQGMILDMRVNAGGDDALSAAFSGFFYKDTVLYEYQTWYNPTDDSIEIWPYRIPHYNPQTLQGYINPKYPVGSLFIEPQGINFPKPVMVLVSPRNISSGEGIPMALQKLPKCKVVGFNGSNGSFGMVESRIYLFLPPDTLYLRFPYGQSLDKNFKIQLDSDSTMLGGVVPDFRVPVNDTVIDQLYIDSIDVELNYAIGELNSMLGINEQNNSNTGLLLEQIFPNPIKSSATISYRLEEGALISLSIYDMYGKLVKTLVDEPQKTGRYSVNWNTQETPPGVYFCRIQTGKVSITRKCIVLK